MARAGRRAAKPRIAQTRILSARVSLGDYALVDQAAQLLGKKKQYVVAEGATKEALRIIGEQSRLLRQLEQLKAGR